MLLFFTLLEPHMRLITEDTHGTSLADIPLSKVNYDVE